MTRTRFVGQLSRHIALRRRQMEFLRALTDLDGSRVRAAQATGIPIGTACRWQASDEWFAERYHAVREALTSDAQTLRENLLARALAQILGKRGGVLGLPALRRILDGLDRREADAAGSAELDRQIEALLRPEDFAR